jgi:UDP-N-acetylglucosamine 2-epimerase (non-hydrolysing)
MKVLTLLGTRPEIIRLSVIMPKLDEVCDHKIVYTNQNFTVSLSDIFWNDLRLRMPDYIFMQTGSPGSFFGNGFRAFEMILDKEKPDKILILGDTNSVLFGILAAKRGIPIYHMEAGNRCYDPSVPEETNRMIIDACSLYNLPYTENSKENLIREGHSKNYVFKTGNPIKEVLCHYIEDINKSNILDALGFRDYIVNEEHHYIDYALLSFHRTENVDNPYRAKQVVEAINKVAEDMPVVYSFHPRTKDQFAKHGIKFSDKVKLIEPCGFFDFVKLEQNAKVVFTDSGTVPEETMLFRVPTIVLRNTTERQELMETGTLILAGTNTEDILRAYSQIGNLKQKWVKPDDYTKENVSDTIVRFLLGQQIRKEVKGHDEY